jgi:hypothetical protein
MNENSAILVVPNTKDGLAIVKYLANEISKQDIYIKLVSKKAFDLIVKNTKGDTK